MKHLDFIGLQKGDALRYYGETKPLIVKSVDNDGRGWWMVEFEDGRTIKSVDPAHILSDFDFTCSKCKDAAVNEWGEVCGKCQLDHQPERFIRIELVMEYRDPEHLAKLLAAHLAGAGMSDSFGVVYEVMNGPLLKKELEYGRMDQRLIQPDHACECGRMIPYNWTQCSVCLDEELRILL